MKSNRSLFSKRALGTSLCVSYGVLYIYDPAQKSCIQFLHSYYYLWNLYRKKIIFNYYLASETVLNIGDNRVESAKCYLCFSRCKYHNFVIRYPSMASPEEKYELIERRLPEALGGESIKAILAEGRSPKAYWGTRDIYTRYEHGNAQHYQQERRLQVAVSVHTQVTSESFSDSIYPAHIGYFVALTKIADFLRADVEVRRFFSSPALFSATCPYCDL